MKIAIIDDHILLLESVKKMFREHSPASKIYTYNSTTAFLKEQPELFPDLFIIDLMIGDASGIDFIETLRNPAKYDHPCKIIVLSSLSDASTIRSAIQKGADGFLNKSCSFEEMTEAIAQVKEGKQYIGKNLHDNLIKTVFIKEQVIYQLSNREKEVLTEVCKGYTIKEIAHALGISIHTVQYYHRSVLSKLKLKRTTELVVFAIQNGLYIPEDKHTVAR